MTSDDNRETDRDLRTITRLQDRIAGLHGVLAAAYSIIRGHGTIRGSLAHQLTQLDAIIHVAMLGEKMRVDSKMTHKIREQFRQDEFMIAVEVCRNYNFSQTWFGQQVKGENPPPFIWIGAKRHFQRKDVDKWLNEVKARSQKIPHYRKPTGNPYLYKLGPHYKGKPSDDGNGKTAILDK